MKPKKSDRIVSEERKQPPEPPQTDHELFLQAFEKPTQIYRYLRTRHAFLPVFLHRTLKYMSGRCQRKANTRENFKVNTLLAKAEAQFRKQQALGFKQEYLNLTFAGFYDRDSAEPKNVDVDVCIVMIGHMKRKDISAPETEISVGKVTVPCNPLTSETCETISIPSDSFCANGTHAAKSYQLRLIVSNSSKSNSVTASRSGTRSRDSNGSDLENQDPPPRKRLRRSSEERSSRSSSENKSRTKAQSETVTYRSEITIYDKHCRCLLTDGEYEMCMEESGAPPEGNYSTRSTWETVCEGNGKVVPWIDIFGKRPVIKFTLSWKPSPLPPIANVRSLTACDEIICNNRIGGRMFDFTAAAKAERAKQKQLGIASSPSKRSKRIFYQFLYNNNTRQQTESTRDDYRCPWCSVNCLRLPSLLSHLRYCHARFSFTYVEHSKGARIDVSINECYDGSYVGNPQDLHSHVGYAFGHNGPVRRIPVTMVLVYRSKKSNSGSAVSDLNEADTEGVSNRQVIHGHNRLYFHSATCQPIRPCEIDIDSEDENDPEWLRQKTQHMIDEFTDVNEGEKELMKLWNLHVMHYNFIGDCRLVSACETFIQQSGATIVRKNLGRNLILHLVNLCDFGLIRPEIVYRIAVQFLRLRRQLEDSNDVVAHDEPVASSV